MFDKGYRFVKSSRSRRNEGALINEHLFAFNNKSGRRYMVQVDEFKHNFYAIKFYPKELRSSPKRFSTHTGDFDMARIVRTCVDVMVSIYRKDPLASFGFIGSPSEGEQMASTTRFRIYAYVMANFFPPEKFQHAEDRGKSIYAIFNRSNGDSQLIEKVEVMANEIYNEDPLIQFIASIG
jgi:hypothetical protein